MIADAPPARATRPVVVVLDDLHWADASSMDSSLLAAESGRRTSAGRRDVPQRRSDFGPAMTEPSLRAVARAQVRRLQLDGLDTAD